MKRILALLALGFVSASRPTKQFTEFARKFKIAFENEIDKANAVLVEFTVGHFYVSGFFKLESGQLIYFSLPDVRNWQPRRPDTYYGSMLWRTVKDTKDFHGGKNRRAILSDGMVIDLANQIYMDEHSISFLIISNDFKVKRTGNVFLGSLY